MNRTVRILIADDHRVVRECLSRFLDAQNGFLVVGKAPDGAEAVLMAQDLKPDVVLMDYEMPKKNGIEAIHEILRDNANVVVIGYSMHDDGPVEKAMLDAGAAAHISKSRSTDELFSVIRKHAGTIS